MTSNISRHRAAEPDPDGRDAPGHHRHVAYVVDDDPAALALLCEIAEDAGWSCRGFTRLRDVRRRMEAERPGILILDDDLPDGSGGDLARDLHDDPEMARVPVVVCTGARPRRKAEISSWAPVVSKPFHIEELEAYLDGARRRNNGRSHQRAAG